MLIHRYFLDIDSIISYIKSDRWNWFYPILSRASEISALVLLITSNNFSQRKLWIWWKRIQRSSYLYFISGWIVAAQWWGNSYYYILGIWGILFIAAEIKNRFFNRN
jgi:DMSO/TMAO reductase YedYZ heme-binding membrane subunit